MSTEVHCSPAVTCVGLTCRMDAMDLPRTWLGRRHSVALSQTAPWGLLSSQGTCRRSGGCPLTPAMGRCASGSSGRCVQTGACCTADITNVLLSDSQQHNITVKYSITAESLQQITDSEVVRFTAGWFKNIRSIYHDKRGQNTLWDKLDHYNLNNFFNNHTLTGGSWFEVQIIKLII